VYGRGDTLFGSVNRGSGWETPVVIGTGLGYRGPTLAVDALGWAWVSWTDSAGQVVLASHNAGCYWSSPETVALCQDGSNPQIASDEYGRIHCCWLAAGTGGLASVRWAYRLTRPGVEEKAKDDRRTQNRGAAVMRRLPAGAVAFDAMGRRVLNPKSGVYFVRAVSGKPSAVSCHKVVIQR
jgi:hypothetical protein